MPIAAAIPAIIGGVGGALGSVFGGGSDGSNSSTIQNLLGLGGGVTGAVLQSQALGNYLDLLKQQAGINQGYAQQGTNRAQTIQQPSQDALMNIIARGGYGGNVGQVNNYVQQLQALQKSINPAYTNVTQNSRTNPQMAHVSDQLNWVAGRLNDPYAAASGIISNSGATPQTQDLYNALMGIGSGASPLQGLLGNTAGSMLGNGGMTPALQQGINEANSIIQQGGSTPGTQSGIQSALGLLQHPYTMQVQAPNILSMQQATNFARDQAATANAQQATAARARALNLGGGPGATVANGTTNSALADFANQASQNESGAVQNALLNQQGLVANTALQTQGLQLQALQQALGQMQTGGNLLQGLSQTDASRLENALSALTSLTGAGTNRASVGSGLAGTDLNSQLAGLSGAISPLNLQQTSLNNAFQNLLGATGQQGNLLNAAGQAYLGGAGLNLSALNSSNNLNLNTLLSMLGSSQTGVSNQLNASGLLSQQANPWLSLAGGALGTNPSYFNSAFMQSPVGNFLTGLGGYMGGH